MLLKPGCVKNDNRPNTNSVHLKWVWCLCDLVLTAANGQQKLSPGNVAWLRVVEEKRRMKTLMLRAQVYLMLKYTD